MIMDGFGMSKDQLHHNRESLMRHAPHDMWSAMGAEWHRGEAIDKLSEDFDNVVLNDIEDMPGDHEVRICLVSGYEVSAPAFSCDTSVHLMMTCRLGCC